MEAECAIFIGMNYFHFLLISPIFLSRKQVNRADYTHDLALVKLKRKGDGSGLEFSEFITPACLPSLDTPDKEGTVCKVSGWGKTDGERLWPFSLAFPKANEGQQRSQGTIH